MTASVHEQKQWFDTCVAFLNRVGIPVYIVEAANEPETFLPKIAIKSGCLYVHPDAFPGDLLHEGGHLATMPAQFRSLAKGNLKKAFDAMQAYLEKHRDGLAAWPENPVARACMQCSDPEATAWQYAAAQHIGLPDEWLFPENSYEGEARDVLMRLRARSYFGINGLQAAGWTVLRENPCKPEIPVYPKLAFWTFP